MKIRCVIVSLIFLLILSSVSASVTLRQAEVYEIGNKELVVGSIRADKAKITVDGVKNIISIGEKKEINGVDISVESIFYVDQPEERTVTVVMSLAFYCGDGNCDTGQNESKDSCCGDCGCNPGFVCSDSVCKSEAQVEKEEEEEEAKRADKCQKDIDCDDNDPDTDDICKSIPGKPNTCLHMPPICKTDIECDDQDPCTVDRCVNKDCFNAKVEEYIACLKKQEVIELEEKPVEASPEVIAEGILDDIVEEEKGLFSRMLNFFFNLF